MSLVGQELRRTSPKSYRYPALFTLPAPSGAEAESRGAEAKGAPSKGRRSLRCESFHHLVYIATPAPPPPESAAPFVAIPHNTRQSGFYRPALRRHLLHLPLTILLCSRGKGYNLPAPAGRSIGGSRILTIVGLRTPGSCGRSKWLKAGMEYQWCRRRATMRLRPYAAPSVGSGVGTYIGLHRLFG